MRWLVLLLVATTACGRSPALLHPSDPVTDFYEVSPGLYRGGRPDAVGLARLAKLGVKTIVNLEDDGDAIARETVWAKTLSLNEISSPMSGAWTPDDHQVDRLLATLADPANYPIYIHCKKGMDRTGVMVALHRVINQGWTPAAARHERDGIGFNHWLVMLDRYYAHKTARYRS